MRRSSRTACQDFQRDGAGDGQDEKQEVDEREALTSSCKLGLVHDSLRKAVDARAVDELPTRVYCFSVPSPYLMTNLLNLLASTIRHMDE